MLGLRCGMLVATKNGCTTPNLPTEAVVASSCLALKFAAGGVKNLAPSSASWLSTGPVKPPHCSDLPWRQPCSAMFTHVAFTANAASLQRLDFTRHTNVEGQHLPLGLKIPPDPAVCQPLDDPQHTIWIWHHWGQTSIKKCQHTWGQTSIRTVNTFGDRPV